MSKKIKIEEKELNVFAQDLEDEINSLVESHQKKTGYSQNDLSFMIYKDEFQKFKVKVCYDATKFTIVYQKHQESVDPT